MDEILDLLYPLFSRICRKVSLLVCTLNKHNKSLCIKFCIKCISCLVIFQLLLTFFYVSYIVQAIVTISNPINLQSIIFVLFRWP